MSQVFVTGPCHIWVAPMGAAYNTTLTYSYLGFTESGLEFTENMAEEEVMADVSGPRVPFDVSYVGKEVYMGGTLVRWAEAVWQSFAARLAGGTFLGIDAASIGSLIRTERLGFAVAVSCPYASKTVYSAAGMPAGFTLYACYLANAWEMNLSTRYKRQRFNIRAIPEWDISTGVGHLGIVGMPTVPSIS